MLSYRHSFHAGNHADLLKHIIQVEILSYLTLKDKAFDYIDTHAGAGAYQLDSAESSKNKEYLSGIGKLYPKSISNYPELSNYFSVIEGLNTNSNLKIYPGSPVVAEILAKKAGSSMVV